MHQNNKGDILCGINRRGFKEYFKKVKLILFYLRKIMSQIDLLIMSHMSGGEKEMVHQ